MKKTIILILAVLPIVLLMVIAVAGRILSLYQHIPVERVEFVDRIGNAYTDEIDFIVPQEGTKQTAIRIYPELASNKKVSYVSSDPAVCTVDADGVISGVHYGSAVVTVKTQDGSRTATLNVLVTADVPFGVTLSESERSLIAGEFFELDAHVDAPVSIDKRVLWSSSDNAVATVNEAGRVVAVAPGEAFITVTTASGGRTASCKVTVEDIEPPVALDLTGIAGVTLASPGKYIVNATEIDLSSALELADGITADDVILSSNVDIVTVDGLVLRLNDGASGIVVLTVKVELPERTYKTAIELLFYAG